MDNRYLRERCPVCRVGALEITNYTANGDGSGYWTAKCTNCGVVFDKMDAKAWHEDKTWILEKTNEGIWILINQDLDVKYDLSNFHDIVRLSMDLNEIMEALKELISKKYSLDVLNSAIWEDILNKPIFGEKNDDSE